MCDVSYRETIAVIRGRRLLPVGYALYTNEISYREAIAVEYDPELAGPLLMEKQKAYPLLERYPTFNGSKSQHAPTGTN